MAGKSATDLIIRLLVEDESLDKVERSKARFDAWGETLEKAAGGAKIALAGIAGVATGTSIAYASLEQANADLAASLNLTEPQAQAAGEAAAAAYANGFGSSQEEVYNTTAAIVSSIAGMRDASAEEIQGLVERVSSISTGFEIEAGRISQVVGQMVTTGLAGSAEQGLDLLTAALQRVPLAVREDVVDAVDEYAPFFQAVGLQGEQAMDALVRASEKGMYGIDKTGDAVKEFSIRATDMSTTSKAAFDELGLDQQEYANKLLAGGEQASIAFDSIVTGLQGIQDPAARANASIALFGTPLEDLGVNEIPAFLSGLQDLGGGMSDTAGSAESMSARMGDTMKAGWAGVRREFEATAAEIGEDLAPAISGLIDWLGDLAGWIGDNSGVAVGLGIAVGIISGGIIAASAALKIFAAAQAIQTAAQVASNVAWLSSPITWIILAIIVAIGLLVAAGVWLVQNWGSVVAWLGDAWNWLWNTVISPVVSAIGAAFEWLSANVFAPVGSFIASVLQGIGDVFNWLYQNVISPVVMAVLTIFGLWAAAIVWLWENAAMPVFNAIGAAFQWLADNVFAPIGARIEIIFQLIGIAFRWLADNVFTPVGAFIGSIFTGIGEVFSWLHANVIVPVAAQIGGVINGVGAVFSWLWANAISPAINGVAGAVNWIWNSIISPVFASISGAVGAVGDTFRNIFGAIGGFISDAFSGAVSAVRGPVNAIIGLVNSAIRGLNGLSLTIPDWVPEVGGQKFGISLPQVPYLATGGVTMGPMLAVVGDNPGGREYIEPVDRVATRMERVALEAATQGAPQAARGPVRLAREDLETLADLLAGAMHPLVVKGTQVQIRTALGV
ncbi:phage tail tape measure protein [Microbacterium arborescens]